MSLSNLHQKPHPKRTRVVIPDAIEKRSLPALPIHKRPLPSLNQSISQFSDNNFGCAARRSTASHSISVQPKYIGSRSLKKVFGYPTLQTGRKSITNWFNSRPSIKHRSFARDRAQTEAVVPSNIPISKSKWRPSLEFIYDDAQLLSALITFTQKQYSEENVLFLQSVQQLNRKIDDLLTNLQSINRATLQQIDFEIIHIYNHYIIANATKQVNLSYNCFNVITSARHKIDEYDLLQKKSLFDICVAEIEKLVKLSILNGFYASDEFQCVASSRPLPPPIVVRAASHNDVSSPSLSVATPLSVPDDGFEYVPATGEQPRREHNDNALQYIMSCNGFDDGSHEWSIEIVECDAADRYEIGVVSEMDSDIKMNEFGICDTPDLGARVVYGCDGTKGSFYYASYNGDNTERCKKDLSLLNIHEDGWKAGDVVKVCLNITKAKIKFYLNHKQVRKTISIEKNENIKYYPVIYINGYGEYKTV